MIVECLMMVTPIFKANSILIVLGKIMIGLVWFKAGFLRLDNLKRSSLIW